MPGKDAMPMLPQIHTLAVVQAHGVDAMGREGR